MIKKYSSRIFIVLLIITFIVFSALVHYKDISRYNIVSGISFDFDGEHFFATCEICLASTTDDFGSKAEYVKGSGFTPSEALYNAGLQSTGTLYTDSVQLYLISKQAAATTEITDFLMSDISNLRAVAVMTEGSASEILNSEKESGTRAKSLSLAEKLKGICRDNGMDIPHVVSYVKTGGEIYVSADGLPVMRGDVQ